MGGQGLAIQDSAVLDAISVLAAAIGERPRMVRVHMPEKRRAAMGYLLNGIVDWLMDEPTLAAAIVEDVARMIEQCTDVEEVRDLSVQIRDLMFSYHPDAGRVAPTEMELRVLRLLEGVQEVGG